MSGQRVNIKNRAVFCVRNIAGTVCIDIRIDKGYLLSDPGHGYIFNFVNTIDNGSTTSKYTTALQSGLMAP